MKNDNLSKNNFKKIIFKYYGIKIKKIEKIDHSFSDCYIIFSDNKYFVKVFNNLEDVKRIKREDEILKFLRKEGFNVPRIIKAKDGDIYINIFNHYIFLENFIEGISLENVNLEDTELITIAKILGKIHQVLNKRYVDINKEVYWQNLNVEKEFNDLNNLLKYLENFPNNSNIELINKAINHKIRMLPELKKMNTIFNGLTYVMTNGDYSKRNLLKDNNGNIYLLDFSDANLYPASWELIRSFFISTDACKKGNVFNYDLFCKYVRAYLEEFPLNIKDLKLMPYLFLYQILTSNYRYQKYLETNNQKYLDFIEWKENMSYFLEENASKISNFILANIENKV